MKHPSVKGARGRVEGALRTHGRLAPKFFCCHCNRFRQTLFHIGNCGRKKSKAAPVGGNA